MIREILRDQDTDALIGKTMAATGIAGAGVQWATDFANTVVLWGNAALVVGGLILLGLRIVKSVRDLKQPPAE